MGRVIAMVLGGRVIGVPVPAKAFAERFAPQSIRDSQKAKYAFKTPFNEYRVFFKGGMEVGDK